MFIFTTALICLVPQTDWYVDANAPTCAAGNGSSTAPFCQLREALTLAQSGDRIFVAPGVYDGQVDVPAGVSVTGTGGAAVTVIDGRGLGRVLRTLLGAPVVLEGLTITGGGGPGTATAAGIEVLGALELRQVAVVDNQGTGLAGGIGLAPSATALTLTGCRVEDNFGGFGGGISAMQPSTIVIEDSTFARNVSGGDGGGVTLFGGALTLRGSTFAHNAAGISGGGVLGAGALTVEGCTFEGNQSGAFGGGLEWLGGSARLVNSTFSGNSSSPLFGGGGGALLQDMTAATASVDHCTFFANDGFDGAGLLVARLPGAAAGATLSNSLLVGNASNPGGSGADLNGPIVSAGYNLFGDVVASGLVATDRTGVPAALSPLRDNGGPTRTHVPHPQSLAIDGAAPSSPLALDQRGAGRTAGLADVGAVEALGETIACAVVPNSIGAAPYIVATGDGSAAANSVSLIVGDLPPGRFGYFLSGTLAGAIANPGGSAGVQCITGIVGRLNRSTLGEVRAADARGTIEVTLDLTRLATPTGTEAILAGDTRLFQLWYRDGTTTPSSNFSEALQVTFR